MIHEDTILTPQSKLLADRGIEFLCYDDGLVECPGKALHTTPSTPSDCKVYINSVGRRHVLRLHCFHSSCREIITEVNDALYRIATKGGHQPILTGAAEGSPRKKLMPTGRSMPFEHLLDMVLTHYPWPYSEISNDPIGRVLEDPELHFVHLLSLFDDDDLVWVGRDIYDSGSPGHKWRFRTPNEWIEEYKRLGPFVCPNPFKPGSISRCEKAVLKRKFLVVESDVLTRDETGAVFRALNEKVCRLRAVVDTANKSLHGWFDYPTIGDARDHENLLVSLKCDPSMLNPSQPCRLPGMLRDGKYQRLIYFDHPQYNVIPPPESGTACNSQLQLNL
ncbi:MAG: hypothetical protein ABIS50_09345 [Luteolibacter sp.]|uniref:hypothetical protein n=1 Tax=Luteolibacter sp. TaxID=1962973 RepID=UPI003265BAC4